VAKTHHAETQFIVETQRNPIHRRKPKKPSSLELPHVDADHHHLMPLINPPSKTQNFSNTNITTIFNQTIKTHHPKQKTKTHQITKTCEIDHLSRLHGQQSLAFLTLETVFLSPRAPLMTQLREKLFIQNDNLDPLMHW
jgi:hypothetical protein